MVDCASLTDLLALWKSDFIKSLIPLVIYTVFDECHRSRCVDLIAALIWLFNGVVEWKVVTARRSTKRWVMGPAGERWKSKMQSSWDVEESGRIKHGLSIYCTGEGTKASYWTWCEITFQSSLFKFAASCHRSVGVAKHMPEVIFYLLAPFASLLIYWDAHDNWFSCDILSDYTSVLDFSSRHNCVLLMNLVERHTPFFSPGVFQNSQHCGRLFFVMRPIEDFMPCLIGCGYE